MATLETTALVIGAGTGGYPCAIRLGQLGVPTILVEKAKPGGVCLNVGCIPSKALISASKTLVKGRHAADMGITFGEPSVDMGKMQAWKRGIIKKLTTGVAGLVKANGATYREGTARFVGRDGARTKVEITGADGTKDLVIAEHVVIATGSLPIEIPGFAPDGRYVVDSTGALDLDRIPESFAVIGGGYIGLELGQTFQRLGSKLTVIEGLDRILTAVDADMAKLVARQIEKDGGTILTGARAEGWREKDGKAAVSVRVGNEVKEVLADVVLVAVGRRPITEGLDLAAVGLSTDAKGFIPVDAQKRTKVPGIYAVGDVVGQPMLAHKASHEGEVVAEVIAGKKAVDDARVIPAVVFTEPEIASAGLGEDEAKAQGLDVRVGKFPFAASGRAMAIGETNGFVKVVLDAKDDRVLGIHIAGPEASDLISEAALAIEMGAFAEDIALTVHPHPTLGEAVMEAAKHAIGEAIHVQNRRR
ncbi:MAG: dihydrolipoyl dehydrogenase [Deltaproteobacteria bacterium]|nr:MAG: dihydrolipoyl dehydrogenase [Deltaproteobacteria bacterium]